MKNSDVLNLLNDIKNYVKDKEYEEIIEYIEKKEIEVKDTKDIAEEYIDQLMKRTADNTYKPLELFLFT